MDIKSPTYVKFKVSLTFAKMPTNLAVGFLPKFHREKARADRRLQPGIDSGFAKFVILANPNPELDSGSKIFGIWVPISLPLIN